MKVELTFRVPDIRRSLLLHVRAALQTYLAQGLRRPGAVRWEGELAGPWVAGLCLPAAHLSTVLVWLQCYTGPYAQALSYGVTLYDPPEPLSVEPEAELRRGLSLLGQRQRHRTPVDYAYRHAADFVRQHGTVARPQLPPGGEIMGVPGFCFANAITSAVKQGWRYVEGYALRLYPVLHAWCETEQGQAYEVTWPDVGRAYLGVSFPLEQAADACWWGDGSVLQDDRRGHPVLRQPWQGPGTGGPWREVPWLTLMRQGRWREARAWIEAHREEGS
jgi:hypothetical protein